MSTTYGAMAQLVAHHTGSVGVRGSSPLSSTIWVLLKTTTSSMPLARKEGLCRLEPLLSAVGFAFPGRLWALTLPRRAARPSNSGLN